MTNSLPAWSTNFTLNVPKDERALFGRLAFQFGARNTSAFVKELIALGLAVKDEAAAAELRRIRKKYYPKL